MTKLCPRGKSAAKRKFKVYPSAYANAYASRICAGKIKDPSGVKRKDFKGRKPAMGGGMMNKRIGLKFGGEKSLETKMIDKKADQTKNVKKLMTKPDAYDPEARFIKGTRASNYGTTNFIRRTTDQVNLKDALKEAKKNNPGFNVRVMSPREQELMKRRKDGRKRATGKRPKNVEPSPPSRKPEEQKRMQNLSRGGRAGYRMGGKCKLAMKGKGRAYGKNS